MPYNSIFTFVFMLPLVFINNSYAKDVVAIETDGKNIYLNQCAGCHGINGEGEEGWEQLNNYGELPAPPHNDEGHTWRHSDNVLFSMIKNGWRDPFNKTDRLTMPAFGSILTDEEILAVIEFLKTQWSDDKREYQSNESHK